MASEIQLIGYPTSGLTTLYAVLHKSLNVVKASDGSPLTRNSANWANAAITLSDSVAANNYVASVPSGTASGRYTVGVYIKAGGSAALGDQMIGGPAILDWDGTAEIVGANVTHGNFVAVSPGSGDGSASETTLQKLLRIAQANNPFARN